MQSQASKVMGAVYESLGTLKCNVCFAETVKLDLLFTAITFHSAASKRSLQYF